MHINILKVWEWMVWGLDLKDLKKIKIIIIKDFSSSKDNNQLKSRNLKKKIKTFFKAKELELVDNIINLF